MLMFLPSFIRGLIAVIFLVANTLFWAVPLLIITLFRFLLPIPFFHRICTRLGIMVGEGWMSVNSFWMKLTQGMNWSVEGLEGLSKKHWYFVVGNHQSAADIFIAQHLFNGRIPMLKFFLKQELIWVPVIGLCWWALDFPFMKRYDRAYLKKHPEKRGKDFESTQKACEKFKHQPVAIMNYVEGTRLTPEKFKKLSGEYNYLMKPKAGGLGYALCAMGGSIQEMLTITILYPNHTQPSAWAFLSGQVDHVSIKIEAHQIPATFLGSDYQNDPEFRKEFQAWLSDKWRGMDHTMAELHEASKAKGWSKS